MFTLVTAAVQDSDGIQWVRGSWKIEFIPNPAIPTIAQYVVDGNTALSPTVTTQRGILDASGSFSVSVYDNTTVTPIGSSWKLTVCPLASAPCSFYNFAAAGNSLNISSALTFLITPPRFLGVYPNYGYNDLEVTPANKPGSTYYNVLQQVQKYYNDQTQQWSIVGTGPAGQPGTPGPPGAAAATPPVIITAPGTDLNTLTISGVYYLEQGTGPNTPSNVINSDMAILEVLAHTTTTFQAPFILQRLWCSQDSWSGAAPGRWYMRWNWWTGSSQVWTSWFYYLPAGTA